MGNEHTTSMRTVGLLALCGLLSVGCKRTEQAAPEQQPAATIQSEATQQASDAAKSSTANLTDSQGNEAGTKAQVQPAPTETNETGFSATPPEGAPGAFGCSGSGRTAFMESFAAQGRSLTRELEASRRSVGGKEVMRKELWRHGRLAILRSVSGTTKDTAALVPGRESLGSEDGADQPNDFARAQGAQGKGASEEWNDEGVRCKRLGALLGSAHVVARTAAELSPEMCETLAPARVGTLAAQVTCRVSARGAKDDLKALASLAPELPTIAPRCGEAYARACAGIFEARLSDSPAEGCRALAKDVSVAAIEAWACGVEAREANPR